MARTKPHTPAARPAAAEATLARPLAPEEVTPGDFVAVLHEIVEFPSWYWCDESAMQPRDETVRVCYVPREDAAPLKVRAACLPFVLVRQPCGRERTVDIRRTRLARLDREYAAAAWKAYKRAAKRNEE